MGESHVENPQPPPVYPSQHSRKEQYIGTMAHVSPMDHVTKSFIVYNQARILFVKGLIVELILFYAQNA